VSRRTRPAALLPQRRSVRQEREDFDALSLERDIVPVIQGERRLDRQLLDALEGKAKEVCQVLLTALGPELVRKGVAREVGLPWVMLRSGSGSARVSMRADACGNGFSLSHAAGGPCAS